MKIARLDTLPRNDSIWDSGEPDNIYEKRQHIAVADNYDFVGNNATDISNLSVNPNAIVDTERLGLLLVDISVPFLRDKKSLREKLKTLVFTKMQVAVPADAVNDAKWNLLTAAEKSIATHWFIIGKDSWQLEVNNSDDYWNNEAAKYRQWTQEDRAYRLALMEAIVFRRVENLSDAKQILADLNQLSKDTVLQIDDATNVLQNTARIKRLASMYVEGLESETDDGIAALKDYIDSTVGTPFEGNGLRNVVYPFKSGHTKDTVADELLNIISSNW